VARLLARTGVLATFAGCLVAAEASAAAWVSLGPTNLSGRILHVAFHPTDPDVVYAASAGGGLWRSTDGGSTWNPLTDDIGSLAIGGVAVGPSDPDLVAIGTGEGTPNVDRIPGVGVLRSTDAGATWEPTGLARDPGDGHGFHFVEANPIRGTLLAGATDGLWRSTDEGVTWTQVRPGGDYYDAKWKPGDPDVCFTVKGNDPSGGNNVKISTDDGATWTKAGSGQPLSLLVGKSKLAVSADDPDVVYALIADATNPAALVDLYRTTDGGATWHPRNSFGLPSGQTWYNLACAADPDDAGTVLAGAWGLARSVDAGATFASVLGSVHTAQHALVFGPGPSAPVWVANDGGVWESVDGGLGWTSRTHGLATVQYWDVSVAQTDPVAAFGGAQRHGILRFDGGDTWEPAGGSGYVCEVCALDADVVYAELAPGSFSRSTDGGDTWSPADGGLTGSAPYVPPLALDPGDCDHLYTSTVTGIHRTTNGGALWTNVAAHVATSIDVSPVDGDVVWTVSGGAVRYTTNDGTTWLDAGPFGFPTGAATRIRAHPGVASAAFVTFSGHGDLAHVARTDDLGASWEGVTGDLPPQPVNTIVIDPLDPGSWYVGADTGVWASSDGGSTWIAHGTGLPNSVVVSLEIRSAARMLVAATHGRGVWEAALAPVGTGVLPAEGAVHLMLDPPSPNPARGRVSVRFAARRPGPVRLDLHDVRGRLVRRLAELPGGDGTIRSVTWSAAELPGGVYFVSLCSGEERRTRKLVITR